MALAGATGAGAYVYRDDVLAAFDGEGEGSPESRRGESEGTGGMSVETFEPEPVTAAIVDRINGVRADARRPNLGRDGTLRRAAERHAQDMHDRDFYAHRNPDGEEPWDRVPCEAAETIHEGFLPTAENIGSDEVWDTSEVGQAAGYVVEGWVLSDAHYQIMIGDEFERVGVGVAEQGGTFYAVAKYC